MKSEELVYIWQSGDWPNWHYDPAVLSEPLARASRAQGHLLGRLADVGLAQRDQASLLALSHDVIKTSEIEGEYLNVQSVRSSIARKLGVDIGAMSPIDREVEGMVEVVMDASVNCQGLITQERLWGWHASLFPTGFSGLRRITTGSWRRDEFGPMQVVSGPMGREHVHYQAPAAQHLESEMNCFLEWANSSTDGPALIKAGLAHFWLVTLHPFDDGNGRISRAVGDLFLSRADGCSQRFYSLSSQIERERQTYYAILESSQKGGMDVTSWLVWFLGALERALNTAELTLDAVLAKAHFWQHHRSVVFNARQVKLLNRLLDGFEGKLTASKWGAIGKCSHDSALRDINELVALGVLKKSTSGGRSTSYDFVAISEKT